MIISYTFHTICFNKIIFIKIDNDFYACYFKAIDTKGVDPMTYPFEYERSNLREDEESHLLELDDVFKNAPRRKGDFFEIVQVIDK